jgi:hypothetical protein
MSSVLFVYYESINRELKIRCIYECRCDERLQSKTKEFTRLAYTVLLLISSTTWASISFFFFLDVVKKFKFLSS